MKAPSPAARQAAEMLAIQALTFIAQEPERFSRFLALSGIEAARLRAAANEPGFLAGVLEHMLGHESLLVAFADSAGIDPAEIARAHSALGGRGRHRAP
jgi:esterase/lipase superfamily enzyme